MSAFGDILVTGLDVLGDSVGLPSLGTLTGEFVDLVTEKSEGQEGPDYSADLQRIQSQLAGIQTQIQSLESNIKNIVKLFKADEVAHYTINIQTVYDEIIALTNLPLNDKTIAQQAKERMATIGEQIININAGILNNCYHLSNYLLKPQTGLFDLQNADLNEKEFLSYFIGIKSILVESYKYFSMAYSAVCWAGSLAKKNLIVFPEYQMWEDKIGSFIGQNKTKDCKLQDYVNANIPLSARKLAKALLKQGTDFPEVKIALRPYLPQSILPSEDACLHLTTQKPSGFYTPPIIDKEYYGLFNGNSKDPNCTIILGACNNLTNITENQEYTFSIKFSNISPKPYLSVEDYIKSKSKYDLKFEEKFKEKDDSHYYQTVASWTLHVNKNGNFRIRFHAPQDVFDQGTSLLKDWQLVTSGDGAELWNTVVDPDANQLTGVRSTVTFQVLLLES